MKRYSIRYPRPLLGINPSCFKCLWFAVHPFIKFSGSFPDCASTFYLIFVVILHISRQTLVNAWSRSGFSTPLFIPVQGFWLSTVSPLPIVSGRCQFLSIFTSTSIHAPSRLFINEIRSYLFTPDLYLSFISFVHSFQLDPAWFFFYYRITYPTFSGCTTPNTALWIKPITRGNIGFFSFWFIFFALFVFNGHSSTDFACPFSFLSIFIFAIIVALARTSPSFFLLMRLPLFIFFHGAEYVEGILLTHACIFCTSFAFRKGDIGIVNVLSNVPRISDNWWVYRVQVVHGNVEKKVLRGLPEPPEDATSKRRLRIRDESKKREHTEYYLGQESDMG